MGDVVALFPAASVAFTAKICVPLIVVVFQVNVYGDALSIAMATPFTSNCTLATLLLSVAVAVTVTIPVTVSPFAGEISATTGLIVSGGAFITNTVIGGVVALFPDPSVALTASVCEPLKPDVFQENVYGDVLSVAVTTPFINNCTLATLTLSVAV